MPDSLSPWGRLLRRPIDLGWERLRAPYATAFGVCFAMLLLRSHERLAQAHLWAEDGRTFLGEAFEHGLGATFMPYAGYLHVVPRLVTWVLSLLPIETYAVALTSVTLALNAAVFALIAKPCHRGLVSHDGVRVLVAVAFCFLPGTWEVTGNVANLHSVLFYGVMLVALQDLDRPLGFAEVLVVLAAATSAGEAVLLAPAFLLRGWMRWRDGRPLREAVGEALAVVALTVPAAMNALLYQSGMPVADFASWPLSRMAEHLWTTFNDRYVLHPVLGDGGTMSYFRRPLGVRIAVTAGFAVVLVLGLRRVPARPRALMLAACACVFLLIPLTWYVRPGAAEFPTFGALREPGVMDARYMLFALPAGVVLWAAALARFRAIFAAGLCVCVVVLAFPRWTFEPWGTERDWATSARIIRETRQTPGAEATVPTNPPGWYISVHGPSRAAK
ncbi:MULTISPECIES: hypothetical protein [unclassified Corallococcus]|uniref:hypothetical protein n=1 Tax=unclassified Corallococcus TaxID=2685029 RepID=UPI001A8D924A|nr:MULTISPECIES: hypothetical protein [unclassified Corallococcus]MBN9683564.1 hypothetical protein [Corallococcus sp. NCSPR001]WAS84924.1 hypothetical protein O0N60_37395 [Corallococcus sp. NCRR]